MVPENPPTVLTAEQKALIQKYRDAETAKVSSSTPAQFVANVYSELSTLTGEIAMRNKTIMQNDSFVYGDLLKRSVTIPVGHDFTPVNWLRRVCEIHRTQTMGDGFTVSSSYHGVDVDSAFDPDAKPQLILENNKRKDMAESRNKLFEAIIRDNGGMATFAQMVENASAVGTSIMKAWYDPDHGKYHIKNVEKIEYFYSVWRTADFREADLHAYVYQISKEEAIRRYNVPDNVAMSPVGMPLTILSSANIYQYISMQPMVTVMEIVGTVQGWCSDNAKDPAPKKVADGLETPVHAIIVGHELKKFVDDPKKLPKYYIFPNKKIRNRPWGLPDITDSSININQTYIETLSDWRTLQNKVNFPKYKGYGFGMGVQMPKFQPRTAEIIGLGEGQDIQPINNPNSVASGEVDYVRALAELKEAFVRETGISQQLFDLPDSTSANSNQAAMTAMKSISDQVEARRQLWGPIIVKVFEDALKCLADWDDSIKELVDDDTDWYIRVEWPPVMRKDDPVFQTNLINRFNAGMISVQSFLEAIGINAKEEVDRINDEMDNPITAAIHGKLLSMLAEFKIAGPPTQAPPKVAISLRGDLTPEQETNLSVMHQFGEGPIFGPTAGPQGELGIRATDDAVNQGHISGQGYSTGQPIISSPQGPQNNGQQQGPQGPTAPMTPTSNNQAGQQPLSQPGSGATSASPSGANNQAAQQAGRK